MKYTYITLGIYFTQIVLTSKLYLVIMYKAKYQLDIGSYAYYLKKNPYPLQNNFSVSILLCILVSLLLELISIVGRGLGSGDTGADILNNT